MSHSFCKIWIHSLWATKGRQPLIQSTVEKSIHEKMRAEFIETGCFVRIINGMPDHVHCLFLLNPRRALADIIKQVKGSSSSWINEENLIADKFSWQTGYTAFSVSESALEIVYQYILNQKQHHMKQSFREEHDEFIKRHGLDKS